MSAKFVGEVDDSRCEPIQNQSNSHQRILVVESERDLRQITAEVLIDAGYQVDVAENGGAAWDALQLYKYDLLIADQFMPKMSGVALLKKIHAARMTLPVIMSNGFLPTWEFALHMWLQPVKMLLKPFTFDELLGMVKNALPKDASACYVNSPLPQQPSEPPLPPPRLFA